MGYLSTDRLSSVDRRRPRSIFSENPRAGSPPFCGAFLLKPSKSILRPPTTLFHPSSLVPSSSSPNPLSFPLQGSVSDDPAPHLGSFHSAFTPFSSFLLRWHPNRSFSLAVVALRRTPEKAPGLLLNAAASIVRIGCRNSSFLKVSVLSDPTAPSRRLSNPGMWTSSP